MNRLRWLWLTPVAFFVFRISGNQLVESAVDQRDAPQTFASDLLANPEAFSVGMYLAGLSGLAFLWFAWALWQRLGQQGFTGPAEVMAFGSAVLWSTLLVAAAALAATAPVLADYYDGLASRVGKKRADIVHQPLDALIVVGPWVLAGRATYKGLKRLRGASRRVRR